MPKPSPFEKYTARYEKWFEKYPCVYQAEIKAVRDMIPVGQYGMEIGTGTGRFSVPLGIKIGIEPSAHMRTIARERGIDVLDGVAENLPFKNETFGFVLFVTTICFVDDLKKSFEEAHRVLKKGGYLITGLVDRKSPLGKMYLEHQLENVFYKDATFYSVEDVISIAKKTGFNDLRFRQTIFSNLPEITEHESVKDGFGDGSFVVIRCTKKR